ncbi:hypothetical protein [Lichenicoccus roseus]|uniref:hypothetical protein n=1 Tax=Lichenicoccus roseus TaxID=2683649 RepID=UPI001F0E34A2|nr:hypothetical protein [Lichenicoccus roseus]
MADRIPTTRQPRSGPRPAAPGATVPRTTRRQLGTRIAAIVLAGALVVVLHFTGVLPRLQSRFFPDPVNWHNDYSTVEHLRSQVVSDGLTHDRKDCLLFIINGNDAPSSQRFQVMEKHSGTCPGQRGQLPLLFTLRVDRDHGVVETDQGSPGRFHPMPGA